MSEAPDAAILARVQPERVIADLRELAALTGGPQGARRVCWTPEWQRAREWLRAKLAELGCTAELDPAGNLWATLRVRDPRAVVVGSHLDAVPAGGWLDGALGIAAALEMLRVYTGTRPAVTLRLVDWADEEGARFGRSLFGSSAAAGTLDLAAARELRDRDGVALPDALAACGVDLARAPEATARMTGVAAYLELHIEQGPVLERDGIAVAPVLGTFGVERHTVCFDGRTSHAGSTPLDLRHDALACAARFVLDVREGARRHGGVATCGAIAVAPGIVTAIPGACTVSLDQRALDAAALAQMLDDARAASERIAADEGASVAWERLWRIEPIPFDPTLLAFAGEACRAEIGVARALPSGALHDAAEMARRVPTVMLFTSSRDGISHSPAEDTPLADIAAAVRAFARLTARTVAWAGEAEPISSSPP